jgi:hypothetical protein
MDNELDRLNWLDWQILIWVPLAFITAREVKANWRTIFDADLSIQDRASLQKINTFFIVPAVVFLHECGHAMATLWAGGTIAEFHFGVFWGYVIPHGHFTPEQDLIIYLAGSGVQVIIGFFMLIGAIFVTSPPVVALLVYSGLSAIAGTIIVYTLMSFTGYYGDWIHIYHSPLTNWVMVIGTVHTMLAGFLFYLFYGSYPKLWFNCKTRPKWFKDYKRAQETIARDPSAVNYLNLAWTLYLVGLTKETARTLEIVRKKDPNLLEYYILAGWLKQDKGQTNAAVELFEHIADAQAATPNQKCRALLAIGHSLASQIENRAARGARPSLDDYTAVIASYEQAHAAEPAVADPLFYKATILNKVGLHKEAEMELKDLQGRKWLDPALSELHLLELQVARKSNNGEQ